MSLAVTYAPVVTDLRDWLRGLDVGGVVGQRVYAGMAPKTLAFPAVVVNRVGGFTDAPVDRPLVQLDCWSDSAEEAEQVAAALCSLLDSTAATAISAAVDLMGARVESVIWAPSEGAHRYALTAELVIKAP